MLAFVDVGRGIAEVTLVGRPPLGAADVQPYLAAAAAKLETTLDAG